MTGSGIRSIVFAIPEAVEEVSVFTNEFESYYIRFSHAHDCQLNAIKLWLWSYLGVYLIVAIRIMDRVLYTIIVFIVVIEAFSCISLSL